MGEAFLYGNGEQNPLNFRVIGSLVQPAAPKENTIWVNTDTTITSWVFAPEAPTNPEGGMIFFKTDKTSPVGFNALRKNKIAVLPTSAQQYIGGKWANKEAYAYIGGKWVQFSWTRVYLYNRGDSCNAITGGYQEISKSTGGTHEESSAMTSNAIHLKVVNYSQHASNIGRSTVNKVDLTNAKTIHISGNCIYTEDLVGVMVCNSRSLDDNGVASAYIRNSGAIDLTIDVSNLTGSYYIIAVARSANKSIATEADIYQIWY